MIEVVAKYDCVKAVGIMHTQAPLVTRGLQSLRENTNLPIFAYPEIGVWKPPHWTSVRLEREVWAEYIKEWVNAGCFMIGGCCGVMPSDVKVISEIIDQQNSKILQE